jgi:hypothetical protein
VSTASVLAAAAALRTFTAAQLAAYCDEDAPAIEAVLDQHPGLVEQLPGGCWRVLDTAALRRRLAKHARLRQARQEHLTRSTRLVRPPDQARAAARLLLAEQVLLDCAAEPDPLARRIMAATAHNHLRQCAAAFTPGGGTWWEVDTSGELSVPEIKVDADLVTVGRLRLNLALARFTGSEASGGTIGMEELVRAAGEVDRLPAQMTGGRRLALVRQFASLSSRVLRLPHGSLSTSAPARFLATVAVRRSADRATRSAQAGRLDQPAGAAVHLIRLLDGLASEPAVRGDGPASRLFRVIDRLPAGRARVAVYADLVPRLPRDCHWDRQGDPLPGAVVEGVADNRAQQHLWDCARLLESDLTGSPFSSESALIGQAAYVLENLAVLRAELDATVLNRAEANRRTLLTLAGVPVQ